MEPKIEYQPKLQQEALAAFQKIQTLATGYLGMNYLAVSDAWLGFEQILVEAERMMLLLPPPDDDDSQPYGGPPDAA